MNNQILMDLLEHVEEAYSVSQIYEILLFQSKDISKLDTLKSVQFYPELYIFQLLPTRPLDLMVAIEQWFL